MLSGNGVGESPSGGPLDVLIELASQGYQAVSWEYPGAACRGLRGLTSRPATDKLRLACTAACILVAVFVHAACEEAPGVQRAADREEESPPLKWLLQFTAVLSLTGLLQEVAFRMTLSADDLKKAYEEDPFLHDRLKLNSTLPIVFSVLSACTSLMAPDVECLVESWLGGHRFVYIVRHMGVLCCAPVLLTQSFKLQLSADGMSWNGSMPSIPLTIAYRVVFWQGLAVREWSASCLCLGLALASYLAASLEHLALAWCLKDTGSAGQLRAALLTGLVATSGCCGLAHFLPALGCISASEVIKLCCALDALFALGTSFSLIAVTDACRHEHQRQQAEGYPDCVQDLANDLGFPVFVVDRDGRVAWCNCKAGDLLGLSPSVAFGTPIADVLRTRRRQEVDVWLGRALLGEKVGCLDAAIARQGGGGEASARTALMASPLLDKRGAVTGVMLVGCVLAEVKAVQEAEMRKFQLMAVMSHELLSPLHGILSFAKILVEEEVDKSKVRMLKMMADSSFRLSRMLKQNIEEAGTGRLDAEAKPKSLEIQRDPVEVAGILQDMVALVRSSLDKAGQPLLKPGVLLTNQAKCLPIVEADAYWCSQVFLSVLTHACELTDRGCITISSRADPKGRWIEILVHDTGRGIPSNSLARLLRPSTPGDAAEALLEEGACLSLSTMQAVLQLHGGFVDVESDVGAGTVFTVRLPTRIDEGESMAEEESRAVTTDVLAERVSEEEEATKPSGQKRAPLAAGAPAPIAEEDYEEDEFVISASAASSAPPVFSRFTSEKPLVLVVDDDEISQMVVERILENKYEVHSVADGCLALEYLKTCGGRLPSFVLLASVLPELSGFEVCRIIRDDLKFDAASLPILIVSADPTACARAKAAQCGCSGFVTKPFSPEVLLAHVASATSPKVVENS